MCPRQITRPPVWRGLILLLAIVALADTACTPAESYKVLTVFFDGVPDPNAAPGDRSFRSRKSPTGKAWLVHAPYAEDKCDSCHLNTDDIFARARVKPDVCASCHADTLAKHKVTHGPVESGACLQCHAPHQSPHVALLRLPMPESCTNCHTQDLLSRGTPEHADPTSNCLNCHNGHGGTDRKMLKGHPLPAPAGAAQ